MAEAAMLELENVNVLYGDFQVLWDVSLSVLPDQVVAVLRD